jgi:glycosyltransferase involved in cell wall biosynthesis
MVLDLPLVSYCLNGCILGAGVLIGFKQIFWMVMNITFIACNEYAPWGGSEELWSQTAISMSQQGFNVSVSIKGWKNEAKEISNIESSGCRVIRRQTNRIQRLISKLNPDISFSFLERFNPDLVIISQSHNLDGLVWMEACLTRNIRFVVIAHNASEESLWPYDDLAMRLGKAYQQAAQCFFVSRSNLKLTEKQLAIELPNAKVIANPFGVNYDVKLAWPKADKTLKLACVGRLEPWQKGQDLLFEIMKLDKWRSRPIELSLFGKGTNQNSLRELKKIWKLENVIFAGFVDRVESIWESHHALILGSRFEGLPIALVEAMLCGRLCIVTNAGGNGELIQNGISGFIANAPTVECIDDAIEKAWQERNSWQKMGEIAAIDVRKAIPRNPIEVFSNELKALLK